MFFKKIKIENHVQKNTEAGGNATPYPDEASSPSLLIKARKAKNDICVRNSCNASGRPTFINLLHWLLILKSCFRMRKPYFFFFSIISARITLAACAAPVAIAAPAAPAAYFLHNILSGFTYTPYNPRLSFTRITCILSLWREYLVIRNWQQMVSGDLQS